MMRTIGYRLSRLLPMVALLSPASVLAASLSFDCDVPPDHYSSVSDDLSGPPTIGATVEAVEMRTGRNLPVAGARFSAGGNSISAGIQIAAASVHAKQFDILLVTKQGETVQKTTLGQIDAPGPITFELAMTEAGTMKVRVGNDSFDVAVPPASYDTGAVTCSTGQFKFSDIHFAKTAAAGR